MYNVYVKRIFVITEFMHMNAGVSSEKEKVKESQSQTVTKGDTPARHPRLTPTSGAGSGASHLTTLIVLNL